ncbi:hypothetical protein [Emticicia sp. 17c]|uniref:hypothetical protein n=1 Tax=Emticicia sp. 17c TaxID=3127704 RepID=UPI00301C0F65
MMKRITNLLFTAPLFIACQNGSISLNTPPNDNDKITIQVSKGINTNYSNFKNLGYQKGDKIPDFTLFTPEGSEFSVDKTLANGKPLVLISGSYTCDISRFNLPEANALGVKYNAQINIYHVYTVEAHPFDKFCPYSSDKTMKIPTANIRDNVQANQPKTYGERRKLAKKWQAENNILIPILVDKPDNDYWLSFGQSPNTAYLIAPDGHVFYKQVWFNYIDLDNAIKDLLRAINHAHS